MSSRRLSSTTRRKLARHSWALGARLAATASKLVTPTARAPVASAIPRTAASPMRMPVKLPGPIVTPTMSSAAADNPDLRITASTIGNSLSVGPRAFAHRSAASTVSPAATTTEQPDPAESSASTICSPDAVTPWPLSIAVRSGFRSQRPSGALTTLFRGFTKPLSDTPGRGMPISQGRREEGASQTARTSTTRGCKEACSRSRLSVAVELGTLSTNLT